MRVQFNSGRHFSSTNVFIHKTVFENSTEICKVCDQYSTNVVKKQLRVYSTNFSCWLMYCSQITLICGCLLRIIITFYSTDFRTF